MKINMKLKKRELIFALILALLSFTALSGYSIWIGTIFNADLVLPGLYTSNGALVMGDSLQGTFYGLNMTLEPGFLFDFTNFSGLTRLNFIPTQINFITTKPTVISWTDPGLYASRCLELGGLRTVTGWSLFGRLMLRNNDETTGIDGRICQKEFSEASAFAGFDMEMCGASHLACFIERELDGFKMVPKFIGCVGLKSVYMVSNCNVCLEKGAPRSTWRSKNSNLPDFYAYAKKTIKPDVFYDIRVGNLINILGTCNTAFSTTTTTPTTTLTTIPTTPTTIPTTSVPTTVPTTTIPTTVPTTLPPTTTTVPTTLPPTLPPTTAAPTLPPRPNNVYCDVSATTPYGSGFITCHLADFSDNGQCKKGCDETAGTRQTFIAMGGQISGGGVCTINLNATFEACNSGKYEETNARSLCNVVSGNTPTTQWCSECEIGQEFLSMTISGKQYLTCGAPAHSLLTTEGGSQISSCPYYLTANISLSIEYGFSILGRELLLLGSGNRFTGIGGIYLIPPLHSPPITIIESCGGYSAFPRVFVEDFNAIPGNTTRTEWTLLGSGINLYLGPGVNNIKVGLLSGLDNFLGTFTSTRIRFSESVILKSINGVIVNTENSTNTVFLLPAISFSNYPSTTIDIEITLLQAPLTIGIDGGTTIEGL